MFKVTCAELHELEGTESGGCSRASAPLSILLLQRSLSYDRLQATPSLAAQRTYGKTSLNLACKSICDQCTARPMSTITITLIWEARPLRVDQRLSAKSGNSVAINAWAIHHSVADRNHSAGTLSKNTRPQSVSSERGSNVGLLIR